MGSLTLSQTILLVAVFYQLFSMVNHKSTKVVPLSFLLLAFGNLVSFYEYYGKNKTISYYDLAILILNLGIFYYGTK